MVSKYRDAGLIEPWDTAKITNFADIDAQFLDSQIFKDDAGVWYIPTDWGATAVAYNTENVPAEDVANLQVFVNPAYQGRTSLPDSADDVWALAYLATGVTDWTKVTDEQFQKAADWLREALPDIPVLGNGDIWSAEDAIAMVEQTGVDGVVIGRGCQGRPWLFGDLQAAFEGRQDRFQPTLGMVADTLYRHAELLVDTFGGDELKALRDIRKHVAWYFKGYPVGSEIRTALSTVPDLATLREILARVDRDQPYPGEAAEGPRGRAGAPKRPHLPDGWLDSRELNAEQQAMIQAAELDVSGG